MKPTTYRSVSAIMLFHNGHAILMDSGEGSYSQIFDHFRDLQLVNEILLKTRFVFITHIHGDHQLGILKIMQERDNLSPCDKLYVVTPTPMMEWM